MTDKDKTDGLFDALDSAVEAYQNNKDTIRSLLGSGGGEYGDGKDPLFESHTNKDSVKIVADVSGETVEEINISVNDGEARIRAGGKDVTLPVPEDTMEDVVDAFVNNGVLEVTIRREGSEE